MDTMGINIGYLVIQLFCFALLIGIVAGVIAIVRHAIFPRRNQEDQTGDSLDQEKA